MNLKSKNEIRRLMYLAARKGLKLPTSRTAEETIELARTARDDNGEFIVPRLLFVEQAPTPPSRPAVEIVRQWREVPDDDRLIPSNPRDRLIVTVAIGTKHQQLLKVSGRYMRQYAEKVGADFIVLSGATQNWWALEKFRVGRLARRYDRTLFLDADVLVHEQSPDLFERVPTDTVAMHDDWNFLSDTCWVNQERRQLCSSQDVQFGEADSSRNSGVVLCGYQQADIWDGPSKPVPGRHCDEQQWIELQAKQHSMFDLPTEFNTQWWFEEFSKLSRHAWFVHFAACPIKQRLEQMKRFLQSWACPAPMPKKRAVKAKREKPKVVTALSLLPRHTERQEKCLKTWKRIGFEIWAMNTAEELEALRPKYPQVHHWIEQNEVSTSYTYPTQLIRNLAGLAIDLDSTVYLINSDLEVRGQAATIGRSQHDVQRYFLRWDYDKGKRTTTAKEFQWGIDAMSFSPDMARALPHDFPYAIGQAMWDYAVPYFMLAAGFKLKFVHERLFFHERHKQNWDQSGWRFGSRWLSDHTELSVTEELPSALWRESLDPNWFYDTQMGLWRSNSKSSHRPLDYQTWKSITSTRGVFRHADKNQVS